MGKSKSRAFNRTINDKFKFMTRESALNSVINNIDSKADVVDTITLFGFSAEEMLEAGASYEDIVSLGGIVN